jgi:hypothetical protein
MHFKFLLLAVLFAVPQLALAKPQCDQKYGIWASEADGVRYVVYGSDGVAYNSDVYFEEWRQSKLAWRAKAKVTCSNGAVTCYGLVENASGLTGDEAITDVVIEEIDEEADGLPEWVVFAGLGQRLYYGGGAKVEWFNDFGPSEDDRITMPNVYRFFDCREQGELALFIPAGDSGKSLVDQLLNESNDRLVRAFISATFKPTARMKAVLAGMNDSVSFEAMIRDGRISSPSDCLPELRGLCFETLKEPTGDTVVYEWGEWVDNTPAAELPDYVGSLVREAAKLGFNLLSDEELAAV